MRFRKCENCGSDKQEWEAFDHYIEQGDPEGRMVCGTCKSVLNSNRYDGAKFVNIYEVNRGYGGPEEGGWWYDYGSVSVSFAIPSGDQEEAKAKLILAQSIVDDWNGDGENRDLGSVNCVGSFLCWIEDHPGRDFPDRKPHYE